MIIRRASHADWPAVWDMIEPVFRAGTTYAIDREIPEAAACAYWLEAPAGCYVACDGDEILGTFYIKANAAGGGAHICNCGYITSAAARGKGIAARMCEWSQTEARRLGFRGMQFNMVLASNTGAVRLWDRLGYETLGTAPRVFDHPELGLVDGHIMFKWLETA